MHEELNFITTMAVVHKNYKYHGWCYYGFSVTDTATVKIWLLSIFL